MTDFAKANHTHHIHHTGICEVFEDVMKSVDINATLVAHVLSETLPKLHKEGVDIGMLQHKHFLELFGLVADGKIEKEGIADVLRALVKRQETPVAWVANHIKTLHCGQPLPNTC